MYIMLCTFCLPPHAATMPCWCSDHSVNWGSFRRRGRKAPWRFGQKNGAFRSQIVPRDFAREFSLDWVKNNCLIPFNACVLHSSFASQVSLSTNLPGWMPTYSYYSGHTWWVFRLSKWLRVDHGHFCCQIAWRMSRRWWLEWRLHCWWAGEEIRHLPLELCEAHLCQLFRWHVRTFGWWPSPWVPSDPSA